MVRNISYNIAIQIEFNRLTIAEKPLYYTQIRNEKFTYSIETVAAGIDHSAGLFMGWKVLGSHPGGNEILRTSPVWPHGPPNFLWYRYWVIPGGKAAGACCCPPTPF
jgi:hypothetical protein